MMAAIAFAAAFVLYISTLSPTISVGDSPELISSAYTLGIAHPPGYPLFSLAGKGFALIPFGGSVAYRVNLLSALLGSISVLFLYLSILEVIGLIRMGSRGERCQTDHLSALLGGLTFAVSPVFWSQAVVAEVYTLNAAFFTCLLWLGLKWISVGAGFKPAPTARPLYLIAFLWGLGLGNHHTMIAFGPVFMLFALMKGKDKDFSLPIPLPAFTLAVTFFLLGLSVYLYLPVRSAQDPFMDWGDAERVGGFLDLLLRRQFALGSRDYSVERGLLHIEYYFAMLREQFTLTGMLLGGAGALFFARRKPATFLFTFALFAIFGFLTILILNPAPLDFYSMDVMIIPSFAIFSVFIGIGFLLAYSGVISLFSKNLTAEREKKSQIFLTLIFLLLPLTLFSLNFNTNNQSNNSFARDYASDIAESVAPNGVLFVEADLSLFPVWYMQSVEGVRKDIAVLDVDMLMLPWFKGQLKEKYPTVEIKIPEIIKHSSGGKFKPLSMEALESYKVSQVEGMVDKIMERHSVYFSYEFGVPFREFGERKDIPLVEKGVVFTVSRGNTSDKSFGDLHALHSITKAIESKDEEVLFIAGAYVQSMERMASKELSSGRRGRAMQIMDAILTVDPYNADILNNLAFLYAEEGGNYLKAEKMVRNALKINPVERGRYLKTLGFIYLKKGEYGKSIEVFNEVIKIEPGSEWTSDRLKEANSKL